MGAGVQRADGGRTGAVVRVCVTQGEWRQGRGQSPGTHAGKPTFISMHAAGTCRGLWVEGCLRLTRVAVVEQGGGAATAGQEGQCWCHETLHDAALPRAEAQAAG